MRNVLFILSLIFSLSCNNLDAAKELSLLTEKPFYASDGWVELTKAGDVYSEKAFVKLENGEIKGSLSHNVGSATGTEGTDFVRLGLKGLADFPQAVKTNLNKIGVSDNIANYSIANGSNGGSYILNGVLVEAKEIALADEIFSLTGRTSIFPKNNLQAIEGFFDNGVPFTMKELDLTNPNITNMTKNINAMYEALTRPNNSVFWTNVEGYLKIPYTSVNTPNGLVQVTQQYVEQQFMTAIVRNAVIVKNNGTLSSIRVVLQDGSTSFLLDLSKLKP
jgi:hypothetical protein